MPATVVPFTSVGDAPPRTVFVDTSFIKALIQFSSDPENARAISSYEFYQKVRRANGRMWTTPFTAEEILWGFVRRELMAAAHGFGLQNIAELKRTRRGDYARTLESCRHHVGTMIKALNRFRISFEFPGDQAAVRGQWGQLVWQRAGQVLEQFAIETADAFHIACATIGGTDHIASLDDDFKEVDGLTVYCYS